PQMFVEVMNIFQTSYSHGGRAIRRITTPHANAVVFITTDRTRAANAVAEILWQALCIGPYFAHLAAQGQNVAAAHCPPLLAAQAGAIKRFTFIQSYTRTHPKIQQKPFARVVLGIDVTPQPLPSPHHSRNREIFG